MKRLYFVLLTIIGMVGLLTVPLAAHAQNAATLTATVDRNSLSMDEALSLTLSLTTPDASMPNLTLGSLEDFRVVGNSQSLQTSIINGAISTTATYIYQLQPVRAGDLVIPGLSLDWNGALLNTEPIAIRVSQGSAPAQAPSVSAVQPQNSLPEAVGGINRKGSHELFIETATDKQSLYVGEAVKYSMRLYNSAMSFGQPAIEPPQFVGFWHPSKPDIQQFYAEGSDGTLYDVTELTSWLFPTTAGQASIDPATATTQGGFLSSGEQVQSDPIEIEVKPLPAGAPAEFNGAVGQFEIQATADRQETRLGEPVTLQVRLSGAGNWGTLGDPEWISDPSWRVYEQAAHSQSDITNGGMSGSRTYEQLWTPLVEGQVTIPAIAYSYFDPTTAEYRTISTQAQTINVTPGDPALAASQPQSPAANAPSTGDQTAAAIKPAPERLTNTPAPLTRQTGYKLLFLVPVGLVAVDLTLALRKRYILNHSAELRRGKAYKKARKQLLRILSSKENPQHEAARILLAYLEDQIQQPLRGLSHSALREVLQDRRLSEELSERVIETLFWGEASEYTNQPPSTPSQVVSRSLKLLEDLEKNRS